MELVGLAEVADMLGVSVQRAHQLSRREDFPEPVKVLRATPVWRRQDVEDWMRATGRKDDNGH